MRRSACLVLADRDALFRIAAGDVVRLTEAATDASFHRDGLTANQIAANRRVVEISGPRAMAAAAGADQYLAAAFVAGRFAGYVISDRHGPGDREPDWLMVHSDFHGRGIAAVLMEERMRWRGPDEPMWLNVIRFNARAIAFYRRFGFEIDPATRTDKAVPNWAMRRRGTNRRHAFSPRALG